MSDTQTCPYCKEEIKAGATKCKHCNQFLDGDSPRDENGVPIPKEIGAYLIEGLLGAGGMGVVYHGRHRTAPQAEKQGGEVCIKKMHEQYQGDPTFRARFEREAAVCIEFDHPNIVKVHDLIIDGGILALVMERVHGRSFAELIGRVTRPMPWDTAWPLFSQLLDAVAYAHAQGVVHRDLKPDNVMVTKDDRIKVLDFGIAKKIQATSSLTGAGLGTVDYMAPEQHTHAGDVDERADIYALGMTLYEILAGRLPWDPGASVADIITLKANGKIPLPTKSYPRIQPQVVEVVMSALDPDPDRRSASVEALREALEQAAGSTQTARPTVPETPAGVPPPKEPPPGSAAPAGGGSEDKKDDAAEGEPSMSPKTLVFVVCVAIVVLAAIAFYFKGRGADQTPPGDRGRHRQGQRLDLPGVWLGHRRMALVRRGCGIPQQPIPHTSDFERRLPGTTRQGPIPLLPGHLYTPAAEGSS